MSEPKSAETKLLPCPFCGGEPQIDGDSDRGYYVICDGCGVVTSEYGCLQKADAWTKWNQRT